MSKRAAAADRLYAAESALHHMGFVQRFPDLACAQDYADHVTASRWFQNRWPNAGTVRVIETTGDNAFYNFRNHSIELPRWFFTDLIVLHELAHMVANDNKHGSRFRLAHLALVSKFMGVSAGRTYRHVLIAYGFDVRG